MNFISNIWQYPKTSADGVLIAVVTIAGVLSQQGISLGKAGTGTVISLVSALATALLALAADPQRCARLGGAARSSVQERTWERALERLADGYREVLGATAATEARDAA